MPGATDKPTPLAAAGAAPMKPNPWALNGISERPLEAADRKRCKSPEPEAIAAQQAHLDIEGDLEARWVGYCPAHSHHRRWELA